MAYTLTLYEREIAKIPAQEYIRDQLVAAAEGLATDAADRAPKDTGAGAESIQAFPELLDGSWVVYVTWNEELYYMAFQEIGTLYIRPHEFLRSALIDRGGTPLR